MTLLKRLPHIPHFKNLVSLFLIAGLTYVFLWRLWAPTLADRAYLPEKSDLAEVFFPPRYYFAKTLATGEFPLWNPHVYSGYPQFADPQAATFYPIALLLAWLAGAQFSMDTLAFDIGLHFFLAGAFTFLFLQHVFESKLPALLGALVFEFGGYLTYYPPLQLSELEVVPWFPLTLLLVTLSIKRRQWRLMALAGVSLGQVFLAGRPQSYLTIGLITIAWLIYTALRANLPRLHIIGLLSMLSGFALGIAAVQWVPTLELTRLSTRSILSFATVSEGGFPFGQLTGFLTPQLLGTQNVYLGLLPLVLAGVAVYRRQGLFWAGIGLVCLFGSVGKHLVLFDLLYLIERLGFPGYLRNVERLAFGLTFSIAVLSGYGVQLIHKETKTLLRSFGIATGSVFLLANLMVGLWLALHSPSESIVPNTPLDTVSFVGMVLGSGYVGLWIFKERPLVAQALLIIVAVLDVMSLNRGRFLVPQAFAPGNDIERVAAAPPGRSSVYRVVFDQTTSQDFGSLLGVDNVRGMPPLMLIDYDRLLSGLDEYRRNLLLNVEVVVTTGLHPDPSFELASQQDDFKYYHFIVSKPRAYLVKNVIEVSNTLEADTILAAPDFDYWNTAVVLGHLGLQPGADLSPLESVEISARSANTLALQVSTEESRLLVIAETYYPGWQVEIDGIPTQLYPTNVALRGVMVPPGTHTMTMTFRPTTFVIGLTLSGLTGLTLLLWFGLAWGRRQRAPSP